MKSSNLRVSFPVKAFMAGWGKGLLPMLSFVDSVCGQTKRGIIW